MEFHVVIAVLLGALLHAGWNASIKGGSHPFFNTILIVVGAGISGLVILPFLSLPAPESWSYIAASVVIHIVYFLLVYAAYRAGDMSQAYPIMRGLPPLLVAIGSIPFINEVLSVGQWFGVGIISAGILLMAVAGRQKGRPSGLPIAFALVNAVVIAIYTLNDGLGARLSGAPLAYTLWMFMLTGGVLGLAVLLATPRPFLAYARQNTATLAIGGVGTAGAYSITLWAMTQAPVATVAALRETSILFAALIAAFVLKETLSPIRWVAVLVITVGVVVKRLT